MPDRSPERSSRKTEKKRISSAVVVSKTFQKVEQRRERSRDRKEQRYRERSLENENERRVGPRMQMDSEIGSREHRRQRITDRLGPRCRRSEEKDDYNDSSRTAERGRRTRHLSPDSNQQRQTVFDRLDPGPMRDRGFGRSIQGGPGRDQRMVEIDINPQDVPRGKRYFLHDDRELPRRQQSDRSRARSRSPLWVHDKFEVLEDEEEDQDMDEAGDNLLGQPKGKEKEREEKRSYRDRNSGTRYKNTDLQI